MRRLLACGMILSTLALAGGCRHVGGKCDCDRTTGLGCDTYGCGAPVSIHPTTTAEKLKDAPREVPNK